MRRSHFYNSQRAQLLCSARRTQGYFTRNMLRLKSRGSWRTSGDCFASAQNLHTATWLKCRRKLATLSIEPQLRPNQAIFHEVGAEALVLRPLLSFALAKRTTRHWGTKVLISVVVYAGGILGCLIWLQALVSPCAIIDKLHIALVADVLCLMRHCFPMLYTSILRGKSEWIRYISIAGTQLCGEQWRWSVRAKSWITNWLRAVD